MSNIIAAVQNANRPTRWLLSQGNKQWDLHWVSSSHHLRSEAERYIKDQFDEHFSAQVIHIQPYLLVMLDQKGGIKAAVGFDGNADQGFFLDQYLEQPIQHLIAEKEATQVANDEIVEVGNLAISNNCDLLSFMFGIGEVLSSMGFRFLVCTGTNSIVKYLCLLEVQPIVIGTAKIERLSDAQQGNWGSYYDHQPQVMYGNLTVIWARLKLQGLLATFQLRSEDV